MARVSTGGGGHVGSLGAGYGIAGQGMLGVAGITGTARTRMDSDGVVRI